MDLLQEINALFKKKFPMYEGPENLIKFPLSNPVTRELSELYNIALHSQRINDLENLIKLNNKNFESVFGGNALDLTVGALSLAFLTPGGLVTNPSYTKSGRLINRAKNVNKWAVTCNPTIDSMSSTSLVFDIFISYDGGNSYTKLTSINHTTSIDSLIITPGNYFAEVSFKDYTFPAKSQHMIQVGISAPGNGTNYQGSVSCTISEE